MNQEQQTKGADGKMQPAETGNASNPSPQHHELEPANSNQLLDERAEKYLREVAGPEDYPDAEDQQEADKIIEENKPGDSGEPLDQ